MGAVAGVAIDVGITAVASAVEAATTTAASTVAEASTAEAEAAIEASADAAAKAATQEASTAAASAADSVASSVSSGIAKMSRLTSEYFKVDTVFKTAMICIHKLEGNSLRVQRLKKYIRILVEMEQKMISIRKWLENHTKDTVILEKISVSVDSGILSNFMSPLAAGLGNLKRLANDVRKLNSKNKRMTDPQIDTMGRCLAKVNSTFESIVMFINEKKKTVNVLSTFPLSEAEVIGWK